jgi:Ni/Fe-hydrogenase 1 B-type cytochrome subunit
MSTASASTKGGPTHDPSGAYRRIYVWELPVRIYHWVNAACVVVLIVTGFIIGRPFALTYSSEAFQQYWFGTVRFIHFVTAFIFFFNFLVRIYWGFVGNRYARWSSFILYRRSQFKELWQILKVDVLQTSPEGRISIGHNALAGLTYFVSFLVFLFQAVTGFALYSSMSSSFLPRLFAWAVPVMGGDFAVRQWHHMAMWFFVVFVLVHVYLVFYHDYVEGRGTTSSIVGGWKFVREERTEK